MAIRRAQIAFQCGTNLPKDQVAITPHYTTTGGTSDQGLADALKTKLLAATPIGATVPFTIKIYDAQGPPPHYPLGSAENVGTTPKPVQIPRELALCLSYYSGKNRPRFRGRIYIPGCFLTQSAGPRPTTSQQNEALLWGDTLFKNLPASTAACVYSRVDNQAYPITATWVDDEWDIVRSRGGRPTARVTGTVP